MGGTAQVRVGTSSFTAAGWKGTFYPEGLKSTNYLNYYSKQFDTVEIDSTWYGPPSERTVRNWYAQTPDNFIFSAKVPQVVTHERCLEGCDEEMSAFLRTMELLGPKLGVLLLQFPYFNKQLFATADPFVRRLEAFLKKLPTGFKFAVEIRNKTWLTPQFQQLLCAHGVSLTMIDHPWMPTAEGWFEEEDPLTAQFGYVRLLGDRYAIEEKTKTWDKTVVDRSREMQDWTSACERITKRGMEVFVYINNHYAGHAPASVREFLTRWRKSQGIEVMAEPTGGADNSLPSAGIHSLKLF